MQEKAEIFARLQKEIFLMQGFKPAPAAPNHFGLGKIEQNFPNGCFPFSGLHEFYCSNPKNAASSIAFISALVSSVLKNSGVAFCIVTEQQIFPPALKLFSINPDQVVFIKLKKKKEVLWVLEEALKCNALTTVIAEVDDLSFTESRRLQLSIEQSGVGCFLMRNKQPNGNSAANSSWQISPLPSIAPDTMPGVGFSCWQVNLVKARNGEPGRWVIEWGDGHFKFHHPLAVMSKILQTKIA